MSRDENVPIEQAPVPLNFLSSGTAFLGMELKFFNIFQAVLLAAVPPIFVFGFLNRYFIFTNVVTTITLVIAASAIFGYIGLVGYNETTIGEFLIDFFKFKKNKRITYYNPRVKTEYRPSYALLETEQAQLLPREKILKMVKDIQEKTRLADQKKAHEIANAQLDETILFEDDFKVVGKSEEYMTDAELKQHRKKKRKEEKDAIKKEKKEQRRSNRTNGTASKFFRKK